LPLLSSYNLGNTLLNQELTAATINRNLSIWPKVTTYWLNVKIMNQKKKQDETR